MKKFILFSFFVLAFFSCGKDDNGGSCSSADFVGTYTGTASCDGETPTTEDVKIEERSGKLYFIDSDGEEYPMTVNGCNFTIPVIDVVFAKVSGSGSLNGKELSSSFEISVIGLASKCTFKGTKP